MDFSDLRRDLENDKPKKSIPKNKKKIIKIKDKPTVKATVTKLPPKPKKKIIKKTAPQQPIKTSSNNNISKPVVEVETIDINNNDNNDISNNDILNNNDISNNNSSLSNEELEDIDIFENTDEEITVINKEAIPEFERIYKDDTIYIQELEEEFINELPIEQQNVKYYQEQIAEKVEKIITLKNIGLDLLDRNEDYPPVFDQYARHQYLTDWIIPVVLDKQKVYQDMDIDESTPENIENETKDKQKDKQKGGEISISTPLSIPNKNDADIEYPPYLETLDVDNDEQTGGVKNDQGVEPISMKKQLLEYDKIFKDYTYNNIIFQQFERKTHELIQPYIMLDKLNNKEVGYQTTLNFNTNLLRYFNIDTSSWTNRIGTGPIYMTTSVSVDTKNKKVAKTKRQVLVNGENINIVGFFLLPKNKYSIPEFIGTGLSRFSKVGNIDNILPSSTKTILIVKNHGLTTGDIIEISNNDYMDGNYTITMIDKDKFTIDYDTTGLDKKDLDKLKKKGEVHADSKLKYNLIKLDKSPGGKIIIQKGKYSSESANLYLFDTFKADQQNYIDILEIVIPTLDEIMNIHKDEIEKSLFFHEIDDILLNYKLHSRQLLIQQFNKIKLSLKKQADKVKNESKQLKIKHNLPPKSTDYVNTIYDNKYFYNKEVTDNYGKYWLKDSPYDNLMQRIVWINNHKDFGNFYFSFIIKNFKKINKSELEKTLKTLKNLESTTKKTLEKEEKVDKFFKKCNSSKFVKSFTHMNDIDNNENENEKYKKGDLALLLNPSKNKTINPENYHTPIILQFDNQNNQWIFKEKASDVETIQYLCSFSDEQIKDINIKDLKSVNCIYTQNGCTSKRLDKIQTKHNLVKKSVDNYQKTIDLPNSQQELNDKIKKALIELNLDIDKIRASSELKKKKIDSGKQTSLDIGEDVPVSIMKIINAITRVNSEYVRLQMMFQLLEKDGIMINNKIYSKKYEGYLMCGHYKYLHIESYTNNNEMKNTIRAKMLAQFGDGGSTEKGFITCKVCGRNLSLVGYDESPGFDKEGRPLNVRENWETGDQAVLLKQLREAEPIICRSATFRKELMSKGLKVDQLEDSIKICQLLQSLQYKIGIQMFRTDFIKTLIDILEQYSQLPSFNSFRKISILKAKSQGLSQDKIKKIDKSGAYKNSYVKFIAARKPSLVAARFLITIQTTVPEYQVKNAVTSCSLESFEGKEGVEYMSCVLHEMKTAKYKGTNGQEKTVFQKDLLNEIFKSIKKYNEKLSIRKLYKKREDYDKLKPELKLLERDVDDPKDKYRIYGEVKRLDKDFEKIVMTTSGNLRKQNNELFSRLRYLGIKIREVINKTLKDKKPILELTMMANACCLDKLDNYIFINFINQHSNDELSRLMDEMFKIHLYLKLFINKGAISKLYIDPKIPVITNNHENYNIINNEIIKKKFKTFCYIGNTKGEYHLFVGSGEMEKCIKCGKFMKEIEKTDFKEQEYLTLLNDIANVTKSTILTGLEQEKQSREMNSNRETNLKKKHSGLQNEINNFINRLTRTLGKAGDTAFRNRYKEFLEELGNYQYEYDLDKLDNENSSNNKKKTSGYDRVKLLDNKNENKIKLLKTYINQYFRKYISMITNGFNIDDATVRIPYLSSEESKELQKYILEDYQKLSKFFTETNQQLFGKLKFDYSIKEVNSIYGDSNRYNCKYTTIVKEAEFPLGDASEVLLYILISSLNKFLTVQGNQKVVAEFIINVFDEILSDEDTYNVPEPVFESYKMRIYNDRFCQAQREYSARIGVLSSETGQQQDLYTLMADDQRTKQRRAKLELQDQEIERLGREKLGDKATDQQMEAFKEEFLKDKEQTDDIYSREFNMTQPKESDEILEVGDDYGEMPQGTENEGDGISVYSQEAEW